ncbi:septation protein A [Sapientia aquatica]|uniref:Inner membrane-spanning protein YciB n=1 Tax=Sapientia aquatica TaxID=1549640 RepID=A0A4R5W6D9_9BURK|nr:septation protein A [Sapientia aquatica]TDK68659.1 septation protein A [Sapientia aquatica]
MKLLFDLFPVILFFAMFRWGEGHAASAKSILQDYFNGLISGGAPTLQQAPILLATIVTIAATVAQIGYLLLRRKKVDGMLWISFVVVTVFGGLTIYFHNETFIKWKPTMLYWCYSMALLVSQVVFKKNLTRSFISVLEEEFAIPESVWSKLNVIWIFFFAAMGALNLVIAYNFSTETWVNFKLFGSMGMMFLFMLAQIIYLSKYNKNPANS